MNHHKLISENELLEMISPEKLVKVKDQFVTKIDESSNEGGVFVIPFRINTKVVVSAHVRFIKGNVAFGRMEWHYFWFILHTGEKITYRSVAEGIIEVLGSVSGFKCDSEIIVDKVDTYKNSVTQAPMGAIILKQFMRINADEYYGYSETAAKPDTVSRAKLLFNDPFTQNEIDAIIKYKWPGSLVHYRIPSDKQKKWFDSRNQVYKIDQEKYKWSPFQEPRLYSDWHIYQQELRINHEKMPSFSEEALRIIITRGITIDKFPST